MYVCMCFEDEANEEYKKYDKTGMGKKPNCQILCKFQYMPSYEKQDIAVWAWNILCSTNFNHRQDTKQGNIKNGNGNDNCSSAAVLHSAATVSHDPQWYNAAITISYSQSYFTDFIFKLTSWNVGTTCIFDMSLKNVIRSSLPNSVFILYSRWLQMSFKFEVA